MADHRAPVIAQRGNTLVRVGVALVVLAAVGAGIAVWLTVGGSSSSEHTAATGPHGQPLPEVEMCSGVPGAVVLRPTGIGCGLVAYLTAIDWTSWKPTSASGTGTFHQDTCVPDCVTGAFKNYRVSISLADPGDWLGHLVFEEITVVPLGGGASVEHVMGQTGSAWGAD